MFMDEDMLAQMMGGGMMGGMMGGMGRRGGPPRRRVKEVPVPVTLAQCYTGCQVSVPHTRKVLCSKCKGKGAKAGSAGMQTCRDCRGQGAVIRLMQIGPGMAQQVQAQCDACCGTGNVIKDKDKCPACNGGRMVDQESPLELQIEPGMGHGQEIQFSGQGDMHPELPQPGNVVVVLQCEKNSLFVRDGDDLVMKKTITLAESLCGTKFIVPQLDGRKLLIDTTQEVIKTGDSRTVIGEGMPIHQSGGKKGNLVINFEITFPETLSESCIAALKSVLPPPPELEADFDRAEAEECHVERQPMERLKEEAKKAEDLDDDEGQGGHTVQCGTQ